MCEVWEKVQNFIEKHQPNKAVAVWVINLFSNSAMSHSHEMLKRRPKQVSLDRFLVKIVWKEKESIEPIDSCDSIGDSESYPI